MTIGCQNLVARESRLAADAQTQAIHREAFQSRQVNRGHDEGFELDCGVSIGRIDGAIRPPDTLCPIEVVMFCLA